MAHNTPTSARVVRAKREDLDCILSWLKREYDEDDGSGFWDNRNVISDELEKPDHLWVVRRKREAVAFHAGEYGAYILSVRKDYRKRGLGTALVIASIERAKRDNVNVLSVQCEPKKSLAFWKRMGFKEYRDSHQSNQLRARFLLTRTFDLPSNLSPVEVKIGFYPEKALYEQGVRLLHEYPVTGALDRDSSIPLKRRVVGLPSDEPEGRNLVVKIEVNGVRRCFRKAKYARDYGVLKSEMDETYYIDRVKPTESDD